MGRETKDLDFALSGAWEELPRIFAARISGRFFWLDEKRLQGRVVKKTGGEISFFDFAPLRGGTVMDDLASRDFTINALALPLGGARRELLDPLAGRDDLLHGMIRACSPAAFDDDPLRLMRAIRFAAELGFAIEENTWETLCAKAALLKAVAGERVRDELFRTLAASGCGVSLQRLWDSGLWGEILALKEWGACAERIPRLEAAERLCMEVGRLFPKSAESLADYLNREVEAGISLRSLIALAAVLGSSARGGTVSPWPSGSASGGKREGSWSMLCRMMKRRLMACWNRALRNGSSTAFSGTASRPARGCSSSPALPAPFPPRLFHVWWGIGLRRTKRGKRTSSSPAGK